MYIIYVILLTLFGLFVYAAIQQIIVGKPFGAKPAPDSILVITAIFILTLLILLYQSMLETLITDKDVFFKWAPIMKTPNKFNWSDIDKVEIINYGFVGYGWRLIPYGTVHNVSGDIGLRLNLKSGRKVILGTQKPEELAQFLRQIHRLK